MIDKLTTLRAVLTIPVLLILSAAIQAETPRLVLFISVNGLYANELEAYAPSLSKNGLIRLTTMGAYTNKAQYQYMSADATTHYASIFTGSTPHYHGIVSERFYSLIDDDIVSCIDDARYAGINSPLNVSPRLLQATTMADQLKLYYPDSKVYSIGLNAESAIMMGGHLADGVIWIDRQTAKIATTTFYNNGLPVWAEKINNDSTIKQLYSNAWYAQKKLKSYQYPPTEPYYGEEIPAFQKFRNSDNMVQNVDNLLHTPLINDVIKDLAVRALRDEQLGTDNAPDMLCIEFNARIKKNDVALCAEKEDLLIRLDENIERLLEAVEISVGIDNSIIIFTSPVTAPSNISRQTDADRINHGTFNADRAMALLNAYLMAIYGQGRWVTGYYNKNIHLNKRLIEDNNVKTNEISDYAAQFITEFSGIHSAITSYQLQTASSMPYDTPARMRNSHYKNRSGDVIFTLLPGWHEKTLDGTHITTSYNYPLPIAIIAPDISSHKLDINVEDVCPTICNMLHIPMPNACIGSISAL